MMTEQDKIIMVIEKTKTGFSAFSESYPIFTTGKNIPELINNAIEAVSLFFEGTEKEIKEDSIKFEIDFKQFFQYYKVINSNFLASRIGMNPTLLSQYVQGHKRPSEKQSRKIIMGIRQIGRELSEIDLINK
jgi:hypothetical protein